MTLHDEEYINSLIEGLKALKSLAYCRYHKVATGEYECPYADVVNNTIVCNRTCVYNSKYCNIEYEYENSIDDEDIVDYPF
ncbi:MAG: hypothetical protein II244_07955 [Clostridia bacterium]|nr:hypothetical protein [Clostridia bacterium]